MFRVFTVVYLASLSLTAGKLVLSCFFSLGYALMYYSVVI